MAWWEQKRVRSGAESERAQGEGGRGEFAGDGHSGGCVNSTAKKNTATNIFIGNNMCADVFRRSGLMSLSSKCIRK